MVNRGVQILVWVTEIGLLVGIPATVIIIVLILTGVIGDGVGA